MDKKRIIWLDYARVFAIISVVFCHAVQTPYTLEVDEWNAIDLFEKVFRTVAFTFGRLGVPIFLYLSGYLLLSKQFHNDNDVKKFYKHNLIPLLITVEIWNVLYNVFLSIYNQCSLNLEVLIENILFLEKVDLLHMWYIPMIIGVYIAIPFVASIVQKFSWKMLWIPMLIVFLCSFVLKTYNEIAVINHWTIYTSKLDLKFFGGTYGLYILLGYAIHEDVIQKIKTHLLVFGSTFFITLSIGIQFYSYHYNQLYKIWYDSPFILLATIFLFELLHRLGKKNVRDYKLINIISKLSFGIFLVHRPVQMILMRVFKMGVLSRPIYVVLIFVTSFLITVGIVYCISRFKAPRRYILFMK